MSDRILITYVYYPNFVYVITLWDPIVFPILQIKELNYERG